MYRSSLVYDEIVRTIIDIYIDYYIQLIVSVGAQRFTIFHKIKHYVFEDKDDAKDDTADYFAKLFMCPIPYLILKKYLL